MCRFQNIDVRTLKFDLRDSFLDTYSGIRWLAYHIIESDEHWALRVKWKWYRFEMKMTTKRNADWESLRMKQVFLGVCVAVNHLYPCIEYRELCTERPSGQWIDVQSSIIHLRLVSVARGNAVAIVRCTNAYGNVQSNRCAFWMF